MAVLFLFGGRGGFYDVWVVEIELDEIIGMDFIRKHNCRLTLGQRRYELALNGNVTECVGGEQLLRCARVAVQVTNRHTT